MSLNAVRVSRDKSVARQHRLHRLQRQFPEYLLGDAGWLEQPTRGVYRRPRGAPAWEQVIISLQAMLGLPVSVGGRTALELQGYVHHLPHTQKEIHLYSDRRLHGWLNNLPSMARFITHNCMRFLPDTGLTGSGVSLSTSPGDVPALPAALRVTRWGEWSWPLVMVTAELAILELLDALPSRETFHDVDVIMEGLVNLRPRRLQPLLERGTSVKVKRLCLFFVDRHQHQWSAHLDRDRITLGKGKRALVTGVRLDSTFAPNLTRGSTAGSRPCGLPVRCNRLLIPWIARFN